ncbi:MAG: methylcobamide--CoM methyltransferase [Oscillospiraceae bacterium]|nr:methylcobamide--CoM methyltransferase [Oscillospiraceae bacterium]
MGKIMDYHCGYDSAVGLGLWAEKEPSLQFPQAYCQREQMALLAQTIRREDGGAFCLLPFCHTLEAEAYGATIDLGDGLTGPRARGYRFSSWKELAELPPLKMETPRLQETLAACRLLKEKGESVLFQISGPMTTLNSLLPSEQLFRALMKETDLVLELFRRMGQDSLRLLKAAEEAGADLLSYADPMASVSIVGPRLTEIISREFTAPYLKQADRRLKAESLLLLCPKTAFALLGTELAQWKEHSLPPGLTYGEGALYLRGKLRFSGQCCVKKRQTTETFRELVLK